MLVFCHNFLSECECFPDVESVILCCISFIATLTKGICLSEKVKAVGYALFFAIKRAMRCNGDDSLKFDKIMRFDHYPIVFEDFNNCYSALFPLVDDCCHRSSVFSSEEEAQKELRSSYLKLFLPEDHPSFSFLSRTDLFWSLKGFSVDTIFKLLPENDDLPTLFARSGRTGMMTLRELIEFSVLYPRWFDPEAASDYDDHFCQILHPSGDEDIDKWEKSFTAQTGPSYMIVSPPDMRLSLNPPACYLFVKQGHGAGRFNIHFVNESFRCNEIDVSVCGTSIGTLMNSLVTKGLLPDAQFCPSA